MQNAMTYRAKRDSALKRLAVYERKQTVMAAKIQATKELVEACDQKIADLEKPKGK